MATAYSALAFRAGLDAAENFIEPGRTGPLPWDIVESSSLQLWLTEPNRWETLLAILKGMDREMIQAIADWDVAVVNRALEEWGLEIRLADMGGRDVFSFAAKVTLAMLYHEEADADYEVCGKPAYRLDNAMKIASRHSFNGSEVVRIETVGGVVYIARKTSDLTGPELIDWCTAASVALCPVDKRVSGVVIPNFRVKVKPNVDDLLGMSTCGWTLAQALAEFELRMGPKGVVMIAAFAGSMTRSILGFSRPLDPRPADFVVEWDFTVWGEMADRPGFVVFAGQASVGDFDEKKVDVMAG